MSRLDVPTLQCDRCKTTTQDIKVMGTYQQVRHSHMSGEDKWDLCPTCWNAFQNFLGEIEREA